MKNFWYLEERHELIYVTKYLVPRILLSSGSTARIPILQESLQARIFDIFIESVFYNDTRSDLCRNYSKLYMDWNNKKHNGELPRYRVCSSKKMEETKFEDLTIKLGYPYVFVHQGDWEHLLLFRNLRYDRILIKEKYQGHGISSGKKMIARLTTW
ncbi:snRNA-activating protein complex subunit 3-like [Dendronephthya gigantea]|uniref:snRNA-activating protein complex subunit 3-like n=1 Tax=Dendronephthya gigantea TaxID=151771 RepID=UPI00106A5057|nr:snRNA-activating protein complex subunit 3-like [Dendronephthya gigantea]